jgi:hypothetical protein
VLYREDCPICQAAIPEYEKLASASDRCGLALVEVPPSSGTTFKDHFTGSRSLLGMLDARREWFIKTPASFFLDDGVLTSIDLSDDN